MILRRIIVSRRSARANSQAAAMLAALSKQRRLWHTHAGNPDGEDIH